MVAKVRTTSLKVRQDIATGNTKIGPEDVSVTLKFGGGLHTRASPDEIDPREAAGGFNFNIDVQNRNLNNRKPFDLIGKLPNGLSVLGGGSLLKADGTVSTIFQGGGVVYKWDGLTTFTNVGTCSASSKLRGHWDSHNFTLNSILLLTDLAVADTIKKWDGTTFSNVTFTNEAGSGFGNFYAKYLKVSNERAIFSNVKDGSGTLPHMIVGSKTSDYTTISVNNKPSSALSTGDPFFLLTPDLRPINGHVEAFGTSMVSTDRGQIFNLTGTTAKDFAFTPFYPGSNSYGDESMVDIGNDIAYGRQGRIESVVSTNTFGNSASADLTTPISDQIAGYNNWTMAFNSRLRHLYAFPVGVSEVWMMDTAVRDQGQTSPWMRFKTTHSMGFQPTFVMPLLDPVDGLEYIFMGDSSGNIYRMEGTGTNGDGGTTNVQTQFLTRLFSAKLDAQVYDVTGYVKYSKSQKATLNLTFRWQGKEVFDEALTVNIPGVTDANYFGSDIYFGGPNYFGSISGRMSRQVITPRGQANEFQLLIESTGNTDISINEIGLRFREATV